MTTQQSESKAIVLGPDDGDSFWQPLPANGFVRNLLNTAKTGGAAQFSMGTQTVAANSFIREHTHEDHEEIIFVLQGRGIARIEGVDHPLEAGSCAYIGSGIKHHFLNPNDEPLSFTVLLMPGGLDDFFARIGRAKTPGDTAPEPFPRPENIAEIERETVFGWVDSSFNQKK
ncbi:cupin domain-containing protein [Bosea sp. TND4EK4]|jgi:quercetin dioxygenase-like cupin family protein|uniref:cupin domain-containing protein n=1 Tax=Bosea sp. TND4EK4 TaxID=1907408 RepID=UPI000953FE95|nr:cupin domain-containing protein [Bosea sp. TND4EK4]SIR46185.1 Cupin domain-containing protein [Bosea sp. TND4EK4]